jgi:hypothetical protein
MKLSNSLFIGLIVLVCNGANVFFRWRAVKGIVEGDGNCAHLTRMIDWTNEATMSYEKGKL